MFLRTFTAKGVANGLYAISLYEVSFTGDGVQRNLIYSGTIQSNTVLRRISLRLTVL